MGTLEKTRRDVMTHRLFLHRFDVLPWHGVLDQNVPLSLEEGVVSLAQHGKSLLPVVSQCRGLGSVLPRRPNRAVLVRPRRTELSLLLAAGALSS